MAWATLGCHKALIENWMLYNEIQDSKGAFWVLTLVGEVLHTPINEGLNTWQDVQTNKWNGFLAFRPFGSIRLSFFWFEGLLASF